MMTVLMLAAMIAVLAYAFNFEYHARKFGVSTSHSAKAMNQAMIAEIAAQIPAGHPFQIVDPGCGNGKLVRDIARAFPAAQVVGLELSPAPYVQASLAQKIFGPKNARFLKVDFFEFDYGQTDVVVMFLPEPVLHKLAEKLAARLRPGVLVLSNAFEMPQGWTPYKGDMVQPLLKRRLYCYRKYLLT